MDSREAIRAEFVAGNTHGVLKQAVRPLATPLMDDAIDKLKENLDSQNRLDLIRKIAEWNPGFTEAELRADADESRRLTNRARGWGETLAIIMVVGGAVAMALVPLPQLVPAGRVGPESRICSPAECSSASARCCNPSCRNG